MLFTGQEPFYGILLSSMDRVPTNAIDTLGVTRSGNVFKLYYNPTFLAQFDIDTTLQLLKHEVLHVAFNHFTIWDGADKNDDEHMHTLRNIAADLEVNCYLDRSKMQVKGMFAEDFGFEKCLGTREYFHLLYHPLPSDIKTVPGQMEMQSKDNGQNNSAPGTQPNSQQQNQTKGQPQEQQQGQGQAPVSGTDKQNSSSAKHDVQTLDNHDLWPKDMSDAEVEQLQQVVDDLLVMAADEVEKSCGTVPRELKGKIECIRKQKKTKPVADWRRYMHRYLGNEFTELIRKSKKRQSKRFPDAAGNRHQRKSHILVGIDTSGSISLPEYHEFFSQIKTLSSVAEFHVVECDAKIQFEYDYRGKPNDVIKGGGGTSFQPVIDLFNKDKRKYEALVYFTDGYCDVPKDTPKETLWVISSHGNPDDRNKFRENGASVVFIPKKQK